MISIIHITLKMHVMDAEYKKTPYQNNNNKNPS